MKNLMNLYKAALIIPMICTLLSGQDTTLTITSDGKVGIGTTNPVSTLEVAGTIHTTSGGVRFPDGSIQTTASYGGISDNLGNHTAVQNINMNGNWLSGDGANEGVFVNENGYVGIGTSSPPVNLSVTAPSGGDGIAVINNSGNVRGLMSITGGGSGFFELYDDGGAKVILNPDYVYLNAANGVGIGTTNPQGKLDINGSIYQRGGELHADYVFEVDYQLESIEEHAKFMWRNKHLKAIPKATVDRDGQEIVEVGSHRKGIVEELEKAHIYIEQLLNRIKELESRLTKLELKQN